MPAGWLSTEAAWLRDWNTANMKGWPCRPFCILIKPLIRIGLTNLADRHGKGMSTTEQSIIVRYSELADPDHMQQSLDAIFFEASHTKAFESVQLRDAFRRRWMGRYLEARPELAHVLFVGGRIAPETLAGYVIGAHEDPALSDRYDDIGYFHLLNDVTRHYPAHLHINLRKDVRGMGLGSTLLECFVADVAAAGLAGVHIVTGAGLRNVRFYKSNGFTFEYEFSWKGKSLVFLGRGTGGACACRTGT